MPAARNCGGVVLPKGAVAPDQVGAASRLIEQRLGAGHCPTLPCSRLSTASAALRPLAAAEAWCSAARDGRHPERFRMQSGTQTVSLPKTRLWPGRIMSAVPALFLLVDGAMKLVQPEVVVKTTVALGYAETVILPLGVVLLACTI